MKYVFFICAALFVGVFSVNAQSGKPATASSVSINGKLLQSSGKPLLYTGIELVPVDSETQVNDARMLATSGIGGLFSFAAVPEGKYTLSINFDEKPSELSPYPTVFYPNTTNRQEAEIFTIDATTKLKGIVFQLPPKLAQRKVSGKVLGSDGKPVTDAFVFLQDVEYDNFDLSFDNKTDRNGVFTLSGFESRQYIAIAFLLDAPPSIYAPPGEPLAVGKTELFTLNSKTAVFTVTLEDIAKKTDVY